MIIDIVIRAVCENQIIAPPSMGYRWI